MWINWLKLFKITTLAPGDAWYLPDLHEESDLQKTFPLSELNRIGFQNPKSVQKVATALLNTLKPSTEKTIILSIEKSMAKCISDAVEGALKKLTTEVIDPQINQKMKKLEPLKQR